MHRRRFLAGSAGVLGGGLAGCLGDGGGGSDTRTPDPGDDAAADGLPPGAEDPPAERAIDADAFPTTTVEGVAVPLAPMDAVHYWHQRREARFADARGSGQFERSHVLGAAHSPAPSGGDDDPVADWPRDERVVCYCGCPHHLSALRAADLIADGYESVYVIDDGFWAWVDLGYPVAGRNVDLAAPLRVVEGRTDPTHAGESAWARTLDGDPQREATRIGGDGRYELHLRFSGVDGDTPLEVETPGYRVRGTLGDLTAGVVTEG